MRRNYFCIVLTALISSWFFCLNQNEALAIGENNNNLLLLSSKYPPHEFEIQIVERRQEETNENLIKSTFQGPGAASINFTGSFLGTVRTTGGITFGGIAGPGMINATVGFDSTKSISLSQNYAIKMLTPQVYTMVAQPIYEYCKFNVRSKRTGRVVDQGQSERPIGLRCTHYTLDEKHNECKPISLTQREEDAEFEGQIEMIANQDKNNNHKSSRFLEFLIAASG